MAALPGGEERHAAPGGVAAKRTADIEMPAALALARLGIALAQPSRDLADQRAHLLDLPGLEPRHRRVPQDLVAQILGLLAAVEQQRLRDRVAHVLAQAIGQRR